MPSLLQLTLAGRTDFRSSFCDWVYVQISLSSNFPTTKKLEHRGEDSLQAWAWPYTLSELCGCFPLQCGLAVSFQRVTLCCSISLACLGISNWTSLVSNSTKCNPGLPLKSCQFSLCILCYQHHPYRFQEVSTALGIHNSPQMSPSSIRLSLHSPSPHLIRPAPVPPAKVYQQSIWLWELMVQEIS